MGVRTWIGGWPAYRQLAADPFGRGAAAKSKATSSLAPRTRTADKVVKSVCPYCAVGCGQNVYVKDEKVIQIEGDPDSPISRGRLCPKGSASLQLTTGGARRYEVLYRRPHGTEWEVLPLETAMDMIADRVAKSVCPYCAVGCGQRIFVKDEKVIQIEGDPDSPISRGRLCPKGSASKSLVTSPLRQQKVLYRRPGGTEWEELALETAMDMIAERTIGAREDGWQDTDDEGRRVDRTMGFAHLGGATLDNEENYLIKKAFTAAGAVSIENQARI